MSITDTIKARWADLSPRAARRALISNRVTLAEFDHSAADGDADACAELIGDGILSPEELARPIVVSPEMVLHVLDVLRDLDLNYCNGRYQQLVVGRIVQTGRPFKSLTVGELEQLFRDAAVEFECRERREQELRNGSL